MLLSPLIGNWREKSMMAWCLLTKVSPKKLSGRKEVELKLFICWFYFFFFLVIAVIGKKKESKERREVKESSMKYKL